MPIFSHICLACSSRKCLAKILFVLGSFFETHFWERACQYSVSALFGALGGGSVGLVWSGLVLPFFLRAVGIFRPTPSFEDGQMLLLPLPLLRVAAAAFAALAAAVAVAVAAPVAPTVAVGAAAVAAAAAVTGLALADTLKGPNPEYFGFLSIFFFEKFKFSSGDSKVVRAPNAVFTVPTCSQCSNLLHKALPKSGEKRPDHL